MNRFEVTDVSSDVVGAPREAIWGVLTDPGLLADLAPLVDSIDRVGDGHWRWQLAGIRALGHRFAPCFTVAMRFDEHDRIEFTHDPPPGATEHAGAAGVYELADVVPGEDAVFPEGGTSVAIELTVHVDLPLPAVSRPAVTAVMERTMARMGDRFAANLRRHLGVNR